jgi:hypothetical protein
MQLRGALSYMGTLLWKRFNLAISHTFCHKSTFASGNYLSAIKSGNSQIYTALLLKSNFIL